ncbi:MAG: twin-arginine translocation signal domain-containing protein, partial [Thermoguttaceae bacterium]
MSTRRCRRDFLRRAAAGATLAGAFGPTVMRSFSAEPSSGRPAVPLDPAIEPLVRLLEETPRERIVETFAAKVREGTGYE